MDTSFISLVLWALIFLAGLLSVELGLSVAIIEISLGVIGGNFLGLQPTPWIAYLAGFGGILLTFLAGAEVDTQVLKSKFKESFFIGGISFAAPFLGAMFYAYYVLGWSWPASKIAGIALSTTSLAVVYAVLVETGLTHTELGKIIMAATFVTDLGTAVALSLLFLEFNWFTLVFLAASALFIFIIPKIYPWICTRYGERVIEPEIKFLFLILVAFMYLAKLGASHAILPAFVLGLALSNQFMKNRKLQHRLRVVAFAIITPFFFINGGMNISLKLLLLNGGSIAADAAGQAGHQDRRGLSAGPQIPPPGGHVHHAPDEHRLDHGDHLFGLRPDRRIYQSNPVLGAGGGRGPERHHPHLYCPEMV